MEFEIDPEAGVKVGQVIEQLNEIGVNVEKVDRVRQTERPIHDLPGRYEAHLTVSWDADS